MDKKTTSPASTDTALLESGELEFGIEIENVIHRTFKLRPAILADAYRAAGAVAVPGDIDSNQSARVAYQMAIDDAQILCQLAQLGTLATIPSPAALVDLLDPDDMAILRQAAASVKKKRAQSKPSSAPIGEPNSSSFVPGTH